MAGIARYATAGLTAAREDFLRRFPGFAATQAIDDLRAADYGRLDRQGHTYLDYTGGALYAESQLRRHHELLTGHVLGNPHSQSPTSLASAELATRAREAVRRFFNAPEDEFEVVFTPNASGALKLVGEAYPFAPGGVFLLSYDNHNSVNGIREFAARKGAAVSYIPVRDEDLRLDPEQVLTALRGAGAPAPPSCSPTRRSRTSAEPSTRSPGSPRPRSSAGTCSSTAPPSRRRTRWTRGPIGADFIPISFYKLFGYPTGSGCLIARREALARLRRPWFAGGTIMLASVQQEDWYRLAPGATGFEDGTVDYLGLPAVTIGIEHLEDVGVGVVHARVGALCSWLLEELRALRHSDGSPLVRVFGPGDGERRGATIALYLVDPAGEPYDVYDVEAAAARSASPCAAAASAIRATARWRTASPAPMWRAASATRAQPSHCSSASRGSRTPPARCRTPSASHWAWRPTSATSTGSWRSPRATATGRHRERRLMSRPCTA